MSFPCIYVLYTKLIHPLHFSLFYLSHLFMVISTGLNILYSFLCRNYISHILLYFIYPLPPQNDLVGLWLELCWICRSTWKKFTCQQYLAFLSMIMEYLSIYLVFLLLFHQLYTFTHIALVHILWIYT
jgi:hypothetical protein